MNEMPSQDSQDLIERHLNGELSEAEFAALKTQLREDAEVRDRYLASVKVDTLLRELAGRRESSPLVPKVSSPKNRAPHLMLIGLGLVGCLGIFFLVAEMFDSRGAAEIGIASGVEWSSKPWDEGEGVKAGDEINLVEGSVEVRFQSGALTRLHGPARFEVTSANSGFLHYGQAFSRADTKASQGFTIQTRSGKFVDQGTEFLTTARSDGFSQMQVTSGAVDAEVEGFEKQRFEKGSGVGIEPGDTPVLIWIESGDGTPDFAFPTIPPPSSADAADLSTTKPAVQLISDDGKGRANQPHRQSGPPALLVDGKGQTGKDRPGESFFFPNGASGMMILDLGREIPVSKIHTYSWHLSEVDPGMRRRAVQRYTLWACGESRPASMPSEESAAGWTRVARVDTDAFFGVLDEPDRPAQQACAIRSNGSPIGSFRYLLFQVLPTPMPDGIPARHTFFGEIDVFTPSEER